MVSPAPPSRSARPANGQNLVMSHLGDVFDERLDGSEERRELRTLAKPLEVPLQRVPFDAQNEAVRRLLAAGKLVTEAMRRSPKALHRALVRSFKLFRSRGFDAVTNILDDHDSLQIDHKPSAATQSRGIDG